MVLAALGVTNDPQGLNSPHQDFFLETHILCILISSEVVTAELFIRLPSLSICLWGARLRAC